jgi:hypothetical protein
VDDNLGDALHQCWPHSTKEWVVGYGRDCHVPIGFIDRARSCMSDQNIVWLDALRRVW